MKTKDSSSLKENLYQEDNYEEDKPNLLSGNCLQKSLFSTLDKVVDIGAQNPYTYEDLFPISKDFRYQDYENFKVFEKKVNGRYNDNFMSFILAYVAKHRRFPLFLFVIR